MHSLYYYFGLIGLLWFQCTSPTPITSEAHPNIIIIFADDLGYGDLACYGSTVHRTPYLDEMAKEGMRFTDFYVSSGVCTPSRASLMTGCYPRRVDMHVNARPFGSVGRQVLFPRASKGLNPSERIIPEILKEKDYATACIGKWHLGDQAPFLPTKHGFDYYFGIPYSNDMNRDFCPLPLMQNEKVIEAPVGQDDLTKRYTEEAVRFIEQHKEEPFFVYFPHSMPHNPVHASEAFRGKSANNIYGDAIEEIDWSVGQIVSALETHGLSENTWLIFTSDNGAASRFGGSNQPLSGWKGSTMEGGMREPCIMKWPKIIPAGSTCEALTTTMDLLPTIAHIVDFELPKAPTIDGKNIYDLLTTNSTSTPYEYFYYYQLEQLQAVRSGNWKLHLALDSMYTNFHRAKFGPGRPLKLVNLETDIKEENDIADQHPEIVQQLLGYAEKAQKELGDLGMEGTKVRAASLVEAPVALLKE